MTLLLTLASGLGLFLFGMNFMSQGIQKTAGAKLRNILNAMTKNKVIAIVFGALFTAIIQSSGATTVMVVSFVNAGMMSLAQSVGIIFGANIGTTITSQLVAFNLTGVAPVILLVGSLFIMFGKRPGTKKIGEIVFGFGALFLGISLMKDAMSDLNAYPRVIEGIAKLSNPVMAILLGLIITVVVQSSSVTVSVVLLMAGQGLIALPVCFYFILGANIGSCTPAVLSSFNAKKDAKRAAMIHVLFNVIGMIVIGTILAFGMNYVQAFIEKISGESLARCVANADTIFKTFQVLILFPFTNQLVKLSKKLIPGEDKSTEEFELQYIGQNNVMTPATAMFEAIQELERMSGLAYENMRLSMEALTEGKKSKAEQVYRTEKQIDFLCKAITDYLVKVSQGELPAADALRIGGMFHVVNDMERIGDHAVNIADNAMVICDDGVELTKKGTRELLEMHEKVMLILEKSLEMFFKEDDSNLKQIMELENEIDQMERELQKNHVKRMAKGKCTPDAGVVFTDLTSGLERVADHATNIAYAILERDPEEDEKE